MVPVTDPILDDQPHAASLMSCRRDEHRSNTGAHRNIARGSDDDEVADSDDVELVERLLALVVAVEQAAQRRRELEPKRAV